MDYRKQIDKQLLSKTKYIVFIAIFGLLAAVMLFLGITSSSNKNDAELQAFDVLDAKSGTSYYLDVVGLDKEWTLKKGSIYYYTVMDSDEYYEIAVLSSSQIKKMSAQINYFSGQASYPKVIQLTGVAKKFTSEMIDALKDVYQLSTSEVRDYFGDYYLDTTSNDSPSYYLLAGMLGFLTLIFVGLSKKEWNQFYKMLDEISASWKLEQCANELTQLGKNMTLITDEYLYSKDNPTIIALKDIDWIYEKVQRTYGIPVLRSLIINSIKFGAITVVIKKKQLDINEVIYKISQANPQVLIGYGSENQKKFKQLKKDHQY